MREKTHKGGLGQRKTVLTKKDSPNEVPRQARRNDTLCRSVRSSETTDLLTDFETETGGNRLTQSHTRRHGATDKIHDQLTNGCLASFIVLLIAVSAYYLAVANTCSVETKLLFISSDLKQPTNAALDQEVQLLKNPNVLLLLAQLPAKNNQDCALNDDSPCGKGWNMEATSYEVGHADQLATSAGFSNYADFVRWISSNLAVDYKATDGNATASLRLSGEDPDFLKAVLNGYVQCYADYRRSVEEELTSPAPQENPKNPSLDNVNDQLQKTDLQYRECDLALKLIDARPGVFSGFVPDSQMSGIPSLSHFQKRILELEINKRQLNVKFTPNSREIKTLDSEIRQIKLAMRECLAEHMFFLKKNRELLLAQKQDFEKKAQGSSKRLKSPCSGKMPNGDSRFYVTQTLQVIQEKPSVYSKALSVKTGELKNSLLALLSLPFNSAELRFLFSSHGDPFVDRNVGVSEENAANSRPGGMHGSSRLSWALDLFPDYDKR